MGNLANWTGWAIAPFDWLQIKGLWIKNILFNHHLGRCFLQASTDLFVKLSLGFLTY
jgi:hypothetical protein